MSMENFLAAVRSEGLMRTSRFKVEMPIPNIFRNKNLYEGDLRKILLYCDSTALPGMSVQTTQARTFGEIREMPWDRLFDNVTMNFYVDNTMDVKIFFDNWIGNIQDPVTRSMAYYDDYRTDITIDVMDVANDTRYSVTLYECYPKMVGSIQMDYASRDVAKLQVSMNYKYWTSAQALSSESDTGLLDQAQTSIIPNEYFTDFNAFQAKINSQIGSAVKIGREAVEEQVLGFGRALV
jgi:hypothetical protein